MLKIVLVLLRLWGFFNFPKLLHHWPSYLSPTLWAVEITQLRIPAGNVFKSQQILILFFFHYSFFPLDLLQKPKFWNPYAHNHGCKVSAVSVTTGLWGPTRVPSILGCPKGFSTVWGFLLWTHCMETRAATPCKGCFQCLPWANSLGLNWSLFSASRCFLILQLQHSPVSSSNTYLNQTISHLFLLPSFGSASAVWLFQCSSMPSLSGITGGHSSKSISETPGRLKEKWESRSRALWQPQICWF